MYIGCPRVVRADYGTENCTVAQLQIAFQMFHDLSACKGFLYGPSTANVVRKCTLQSCVYYYFDPLYT